MKTRLRSELHELLIKDNISLESGIVNRLLFQMMGIPFSERSYDSDGLNLSSYRGDTDEKVTFRLPEITMTQLLDSLDFLAFPRQEYKTSPYLTLSQHSVDALVAKFKTCYAETKVKNPDLITEYRVKSKGILEATAIETLKSYTDKACDTIAASPSEKLEAVEDAMLLLRKKVERLSQRPDYYKAIIKTTDKISALTQSADVKQNDELAKQLQLVSKGIAIFKDCHRYESVIANTTFAKEIEAFLNGIHIASSECSIIEDVVLGLSDAKLGPNGEASAAIGSDASRYVFNFADISKADTQKIINLFRTMGDETAIEGHGYASHGSAIPEHAEASAAAFMMPSRPQRERVYIERHSIEIDGKFLLETLLPTLKSEVRHIQQQTPEKIAGYVEKSKKYLEEKTKAATAKLAGNKSSFYQLGESADPTDLNDEPAATLQY